MKSMKRWLASVLSVVMLLSLLPTAAMAAPESAAAADADSAPVTVSLKPSEKHRGNVTVNVTINETADAETLNIPAIAHTALDKWFQTWNDWEGSSFDPGNFVFFHLNVTNNSPYTYRYVPGSGQTSPDAFDFDKKDTVVYRTLNPALHKLMSETKFEASDFTSSEIMASYYPQLREAARLWFGEKNATPESIVENINKFFLACTSDSRSERLTDENGKFIGWGKETRKVDVYLSDEAVAAHLYKYYDLGKSADTKELSTAQIIETYLDRYYCTFYGVESLEDMTIDQLKSLFSGVEEGLGIEEIAPDTYGPSDHAFFIYAPETNTAVAKAGWTYMYSFMMTFGLWKDASDQFDPHNPTEVMGHLLKTPAILGNATNEAFPANPAYLDNALGGEASPLKALEPGETGSVTLAVTKNGPFDRNCYRQRIYDFSFSFQMDRELPRLGSLTVSKNVTGEDAPAEQAFRFILELNAQPAVSGTFGGVEIVDNRAEFSLTNGGSVTLTGLPAGVSYEVIEKPVKNYESSILVNGEEKELAVGRIPLDGVDAVVFTNNYEKPEPPQWDTSKSKTATELNSKYESRVTLSLPSAEEKLVSDVVFVLDESSCGKPVRAEVGSMLNDLYAHIKDTGATIRVGAVQFRGVNREMPLTQLNEETAEQIRSFMSVRPLVGGSNMSAGLLAAEKMLDADTSVSADRKYLILVSDGIAYIWDDETTPEQENYGINFQADPTANPPSPTLAGPDGWDVKYGHKYVPRNWDTHMEMVAGLLDKTISEKASLYSRIKSEATAGKPFITAAEQADYVSTVDVSLYKSMKAYDRIADKYTAFVVNSGEEDEMKYYPYGPSFMEYLSDGCTVSFDEIENEIYYLLDAGTTVVDVIGSGKDSQDNAYNMDFVPEAEQLQLTVGGTALPVTELEEDLVFAFGEKTGSSYPFVLRYFPQGSSREQAEHFVWEINTPISSFAPVQLTYTVRLTDPQTEPGVYEQLLTNNRATLYPVDTNGVEGLPEDFEKPVVSYEISRPSRPTPLNTKDHYSYIIGYKDGTVRPYGTISRGEVVTIFFRLLTDEARDKYWSQDNPFTDCSAELWCNNAISTLYNMGQETGVHLIDGFADNTFRPYEKITRAQFAKIAVGFFEETAKEYEGLYTDVAADAWYTSYIEAASRVGLIQGFEDGTFRPNVNITRAQACVIVNRALDRHPVEEHLLPTREMVNWPDNNPGDWFYADIMEATNSHDYRWYQTSDFDENGERIRYERWTDKLEQRDWAAFEHAWSDAHSAPGGEVVKD